MQFGFRKYHSTESACCYFIKIIKPTLDKGVVVGLVFDDPHKAFDTVNHIILLKKLVNYSFSNKTLNWINPYLTDRIQCVRVKKTHGYQGSILGSMLFSLYINDLPSVRDDAEILMYADDTVIYTEGRDAEQVAAKLS